MIEFLLSLTLISFSINKGQTMRSTNNLEEYLFYSQVYFLFLVVNKKNLSEGTLSNVSYESNMRKKVLKNLSVHYFQICMH